MWGKKGSCAVERYHLKKKMSPASTDGSSSQCERCTRRERQFTPVQDSAPESVFHHRLELFLFLQTGSGLLPCCGLNQ